MFSLRLVQHMKMDWPSRVSVAVFPSSLSLPLSPHHPSPKSHATNPHHFVLNPQWFIGAGKKKMTCPSSLLSFFRSFGRNIYLQLCLGWEKKKRFFFFWTFGNFFRFQKFQKLDFWDKFFFFLDLFTKTMPQNNRRGPFTAWSCMFHLVLRRICKRVLCVCVRGGGGERFLLLVPATALGETRSRLETGAANLGGLSHKPSPPLKSGCTSQASLWNSVAFCFDNAIEYAAGRVSLTFFFLNVL